MHQVCSSLFQWGAVQLLLPGRGAHFRLGAYHLEYRDRQPLRHSQLSRKLRRDAEWSTAGVPSKGFDLCEFALVTGGFFDVLVSNVLGHTHPCLETDGRRTSSSSQSVLARR